MSEIEGNVGMMRVERSDRVRHSFCQEDFVGSCLYIGKLVKFVVTTYSDLLY